MKYRDRNIYYKRLVVGIAILLMVWIVWIIKDPENYFTSRSLIFGGDSLEHFQLLYASTPYNLRTHVTNISEVPNRLTLKNKFDNSQFSRLRKAKENFERTIRSCLGSYCMDERFPDPNNLEGDKIQRIGILSPDNRFDWQKFADSVQLLDVKRNSAKPRVIASTHVPAYGYGRNHGWSKIVRIVDDIDIQAYLLLKHNKVNDNFIDLFGVQIRQLLRWHCRLNHVAAHTSMLTVYSKDLLSHPHFEIDKLLTFLGIRASLDQIESLVARNMDTFTSIWGPASEPLPGMFNNLTITSIQNEMEISSNLSNWPCKSFLDLEQSYGVLPYSRYFDLAADCSDPQVKCSVPYDLKERKPT